MEDTGDYLGLLCLRCGDMHGAALACQGCDYSCPERPRTEGRGQLRERI